MRTLYRARIGKGRPDALFRVVAIGKTPIGGLSICDGQLCSFWRESFGIEYLA